MNRQCNSSLPSLGYFNFFIFDTFSTWGESETIETLLPETDKRRRAAIKQAFGKATHADGSNGSINELLSALSAIPQDEQNIARKSKSIQEVVRKFGQTDFDTHHTLTELIPHVNAVISQKFGEGNVGQFIVKLWNLLLEHYKEFVRSCVVDEETGAKAFDYFLMHEAPIIGIDLLCSMLKVRRLSMGDERDALFLPENNQVVWPLRAHLNGLLRDTGQSFYTLEKFHRISQEIGNRNFTSELIWSEVDKTSEICEKTKQLISRMNSGTRISWNNLNQCVLPLAVKPPLNLSKEDISLHSYFAYWLHNLVVCRQKMLGDSAPNQSELNEIYSHINNRFNENIKTNCSFELAPLTDNLEMKLLDHENSYDDSMRSKLFADIESLALALKKKKKIYANCSFFSKRKLGPNFLDFWSIRHDTRLREICLFTLEQEIQLKTPAWLHHWTAARINLINGEIETSMKHYVNAFEDAKYKTGEYFLPLYYDLMALSLLLHKGLSNEQNMEPFRLQLQQFGEKPAHFASLTGYIPRTVNNSKTHIAAFENPLIYWMHRNSIKEIFDGMKVILGNPQIEIIRSSR